MYDALLGLGDVLRYTWETLLRSLKFGGTFFWGGLAPYDRCRHIMLWCECKEKNWMNGWMDEWMNGWMDEWMNGWMDEWMNGWMDEWIGWMNGWMSCHDFVVAGSFMPWESVMLCHSGRRQVSWTQAPQVWLFKHTMCCCSTGHWVK